MQQGFHFSFQTFHSPDQSIFSFIFRNFGLFALAQKNPKLGKFLSQAYEMGVLKKACQIKDSLRYSFKIFQVEEFMSLVRIPDAQVHIQVQNALGQGGFGAVYRGRWGNRDVAVKKLHGGTIPGYVRGALIQESQILASLNHDHVIKFLGVLTSDTGFVMELMESSLYDAIHGNSFASWPLIRKIQVIKDSVSGLCFLHSRNVIHRDLKSLNILLRDGRAKLADFGLAKTRDRTQEMTKYQGTLYWMAPEQMRGDKYGLSADVYSMGVVIWEVLHQKQPLENMRRSTIINLVGYLNKRDSIDSRIPAILKSVIESTWKVPSQRPTAQRLVDVIATIWRKVQRNQSLDGVPVPQDLQQVSYINMADPEERWGVVLATWGGAFRIANLTCCNC